MLLTRQNLYKQLLRSLGKCCTVLGRLHGYRKKNTYTNKKRQWSWMYFKGIVAWDGFWSILSFLVWIESVPLFCQLLLLASSTCWGKIKAVVNLWSSRQRWVSTQASPSTGRRWSNTRHLIERIKYRIFSNNRRQKSRPLHRPISIVADPAF